MNFEENKKAEKTEQENFQENETEKEFSISKLDDLLKGKVNSYDNLNKVTVGILSEAGFDLKGRREAVDKTNDKYDESAYVKAGFWQKFDNFARFGLRKKDYGLLKSKERGLLDKTKIVEGVLRKDIEIKDNKEREFAQKEIVDIRGDFKKENSERIITKRFEKVDDEIIKIVASERTEAGVIEFAGKIRDEKIEQIAKMDGAELVKLKEQFDMDSKNKENFSEITKFMAPERKKELEEKMIAEEKSAKERIKEKEEEINEKLNIFREPFERRLEETTNCEKFLSFVLNDAKDKEAGFNKETKEYEAIIKQAQKLSMFGGVNKDIAMEMEEKKVESENQAKHFAEMKVIASVRLEQLKNNKREVETVLGKINSIGKTKKEIEEEKKGKKIDETVKKENTATETASKLKEEKWDETLNEAWGLSAKKEEVLEVENKQEEEGEQMREKQENAAEKLYLDKDKEKIEKMAKKELAKLGLDKIIKDEKIRREVLKEVMAKFNENKKRGVDFTTKGGINAEAKRVFERIKREYKPK